MIVLMTMMMVLLIMIMIPINESTTMKHTFTWPERKDDDDENDDEGGRRIGAAFLSTWVIMLDTREEMIIEDILLYLHLYLTWCMCYKRYKMDEMDDVEAYNNSYDTD